MDKVYIVTSGEYSDYHIDAVFSCSEHAEEYKERGGGDCVEEFPLDEPIPEALFYVRMTIDGRIDPVTRPAINREVGFVYFCNPWPPGPPELVWVVKTDDKERAIKVVNEKRIQILALNIWNNDKKVSEMVK